MTDVHHTLVTRRVNEQLKKWRTRVAADLCDAKHDAINAQITPEGGRVCRVCSQGGCR